MPGHFGLYLAMKKLWENREPDNIGMTDLTIAHSMDLDSIMRTGNCKIFRLWRLSAYSMHVLLASDLSI